MWNINNKGDSFMFLNKVLAIVVTYNRIELLKENIVALKNVVGEPDILVIDNHSTDETADYLKNNKIDNIRMDNNVGGAGGFSFGIKEAIRRGYKYIWLMDDDTIPCKDSLNKLMDAAIKVDNKFGFLCSYVEWIDGSPCNMNIPRLSSIGCRRDNEYASEGIIKCKEASFVSMLINADTVKAIGLPIKEFFIWGDDVEYSSRISEYESSYFIPCSVVVHKMKSNNPTDIVSDRIDRIDRYKLLYRNRTYMARKKGRKEIILNNLSVIYQLYKIMRAKTDSKWKRLGSVICGWIEGYHFNPQVENI